MTWGKKHSTVLSTMSGHDALKYHKCFNMYWQGNPYHNHFNNRPIPHFAPHSTLTHSHISIIPQHQSYITQNSFIPEANSNPNWLVVIGATKHVTSDINNLIISNEHTRPE